MIGELHRLPGSCLNSLVAAFHSDSWRRALTFSALVLVLASSTSGQNNADLHIDHFDAPSPSRVYRSYHGETVKVWGGYGIYFEKAKVDLQHVPATGAKKALSISYRLPPYFDWGNWLSVRREFERPLDLRNYKGLKLSVRTESAENTRFRITLTDVKDDRDVSIHGADELWWFDAPATLLTPGTGVQTLYAPFDEFYLGYGAGMRWNDKKLDLSRIVAFEINLVSSGGTEGRGTVIVDCLRAYREKR